MHNETSEQADTPDMSHLYIHEDYINVSATSDAYCERGDRTPAIDKFQWTLFDSGTVLLLLEGFDCRGEN